MNTNKHTKLRCRSVAPTVLIALLFMSTVLAQPPVTADDAWVRAAPPGARVMAAYLTLKNGSRRDAVLAGVESSKFEHVEIHRSSMEGGMARMEKLDTLELPRRSVVKLEPGGLHLMLVGPLESIHDGDMVDLTLTMEDGWSLELTVPVRRGD